MSWEVTMRPSRFTTFIVVGMLATGCVKTHECKVVRYEPGSTTLAHD